VNLVRKGDQNFLVVKIKKITNEALQIKDYYSFNLEGHPSYVSEFVWKN